MAAGRKVVGSAQLRQGNALLQHGSVLLTGSQEIVARVTRGIPAASLDAPLERFLDRTVGFAEIAEAIGEAAREWGDDWDGIADPADMLSAAERHVDRFGSDEWTWCR
jgi:lipoate-protein ligase A